MPVQDVQYGGTSLQDTSVPASQILTRDILFEDIAEKTLNVQDDSIRDGFSFLDAKLTRKTITLSGWLLSDTAANLRTHIDNVKGYLRPNDRDLDIETYGGSGIYRRYRGSCQSFVCNEEHWQITQKPYTATFLCEPYGTAISTSTIDLNSGGNIAATPYSESVNFTGSYGPKPTITITVVAETDMTAIKFENTTTSDWIQIARSFSAADVLVINCDTEVVQVNGSNVDFTGAFPSFNPGSNSLRIITTDSGAFQITVSIVYYPTYL